MSTMAEAMRDMVKNQHKFGIYYKLLDFLEAQITILIELSVSSNRSECRVLLEPLVQKFAEQRTTIDTENVFKAMNRSTILKDLKEYFEVETRGFNVIINKDDIVKELSIWNKCDMLIKW